MAYTATLRSVRASALKLRPIADQIRGLPIDQALNLLNFSFKKGSALIKKVLESAIANAENDGADIDSLKISAIMIDEAGAYKRILPRAKGRSNRILKRLSHINIQLSE